VQEDGRLFRAENPFVGWENIVNKILIIDDDELDIQLVRFLLANEGYDVVSTTDGPQGIELYKIHHPFLVFLDLGLPSMSGIDVLKEIRAYDHEATVILLTGYGSVESAVAAIKSGAADFIEKSWDAEDLIQRIHSTLQRYGKRKNHAAPDAN
jgi:DNA-binding NtrC family response regulator